MAVSVSALEAGDLVSWLNEGQPELVFGLVLRRLTSTEISEHSVPGTTAVWVMAPGGEPPGADIIDDTATILAVTKASKTAPDDLGPSIGLANPN